MRNFLTVFTKTFKLCWSDKASVIILTIFPIVLVFVLGNALSGFIEPDFDFGTVPVAVIAEKDSSLGEFLQSEDISRFLEVTFTDEDTALELLEEGGAEIIITEENGVLTVIRPQSATLGSSVAASIVDSYSQIGAAMTIAIMNGENPLELLPLTYEEISVIEASLGTRTQSAIDYYAVTMLVMILLFTGMTGMEVFSRNIFSERILVTPVSKPALLGGLLAATTVTSYLQGMVTFLFTWLVYGAYWGENIPLVLLTLFGVTLFSQAFAIFVLLLFMNPGAIMVVLQAGIWAMTFVSDGYTKVDFGAAEAVFRYSPNSLAHSILFGSAFGGNEERMYFDLALIFIYGAVLFILAFLLGKRRLKSS